MADLFTYLNKARREHDTRIREQKDAANEINARKCVEALVKMGVPKEIAADHISIRDGAVTYRGSGGRTVKLRYVSDGAAYWGLKVWGRCPSCGEYDWSRDCLDLEEIALQVDREFQPHSGHRCKDKVK